MILIGSLALAHHLGTWDIRGVKDTDLVGTYEELQDTIKTLQPISYYPINEGASYFIKARNGNIMEFEIAWPGSRAEKFLAFMSTQPTVPSRVLRVKVPELDVLYLLKMSHRFKKNSPHFMKTMQDIHTMRELGAQIRPEHMEFFLQREKDTYTNHTPKLNVTKQTFFDSSATGVIQKYDHDSIHEAVKHLEKPAYSYFKPDETEVFCSKELFDKCAEPIKLYAVLEESYVLALERSLVPHPGVKTPKEAFDMALEKVCTSITSGWFREYAWENYFKVQTLYSESFVNNFYAGLEDGTVKLKGDTQ